MAKKEAAAEVASLSPAEMLTGGGLKSDFRGIIREAVFAPWDYEGNIDHATLAARLTIEEVDSEDDDPQPIVQHWSAGDLAAFVPSQDGKTATDGEGMEIEPGPYALRVGKKTGLNDNTNFAHLMESIVAAGKASKKFGTDNLTASLECLEGLDAHWDRVPQKKRSGLVEAEGTRKGRDVLVVSQVYGYRDEKKGKSKPVAAPTKKGKPAPVEDEDEGETLDERLSSVVMEALANAPGQKLKKGKLATIVLEEMAGDKEKGKAIKRCTQDDFLESGSWTYDGDTGILSID